MATKKKTRTTSGKKTTMTEAATTNRKRNASGAKKTAAKKKSAPRGKKTAARGVARKVSPTRGVTVDDWSKKLTGWHADAMRLIRALVARHAPLSTASIKWGRPVWEQNGPFAWAQPAAKHVTFGFWRGAELSDPSGILEGTGDRMRHVKITSTDDVSRLPLDAFVKEAVELNREKGDPTKRRGGSGGPS